MNEGGNNEDKKPVGHDERQKIAQEITEADEYINLLNEYQGLIIEAQTPDGGDKYHGFLPSSGATRGRINIEKEALEGLQQKLKDKNIDASN